MPATAGRVKMPANNRMQTSASLNTHSIWQNAIGYDPYAAESTGADTGANQEAAASARENMKALLALANKNKAGGVDAEEKGGWKGRGTLRGGWAGGKDLGEVPMEALPQKPALPGAGAADDMPSSTSSFSGDEDGDVRAAAAAAVPKESKESKKRARSESSDSEEERRKRKKKEKHKKEKRREHKHKKEKKHTKHKRRHQSD